MKKPGIATLPLHYGHIPAWLADRMARRLGLAIMECILRDFGKQEYLKPKKAGGFFLVSKSGLCAGDGLAYSWVYSIKHLDNFLNFASAQ